MPPAIGGAQFFGNHPMSGAPNNYSSAVRGPFLVYSNATAPGAIPGARPLYLCITTAAQPSTDGQPSAAAAQLSNAAAQPRHFLATADSCNAAGAPIGLQGYVAGLRSGAMPRALRTCANAATGGPYHAVDGPSRGAPADEQVALLGCVM